MTSKAVALKRLRKELAELQKSPPVEMSVGPVGDNMFHWEGFLRGPKKSPYEEGMFKFSVKFPDDYPMRPPNVTFLSKVYHPNVDEKQGSICVDILQNHWTSVYTISQVMLSLSSLLTDPNPKSPLNSDSADLYLRDRKAYDAKVRKYVRLYANPEKILK